MRKAIMKKSILLLVALTFAASACVKEVYEINKSAQTPEDFKAIVEGGEDTKTSMSDNMVIWDRKDKVALMRGTTGRSIFSVVDGTEGKTSCTLREVDEFSSYTEDGSVPEHMAINDNVAYYPYDGLISTSPSAGSYLLNVNLPSEQTWAENSFASGILPMVAVTDGLDDRTLAFKNVLGFLRISLDGSIMPKKVILRGNKGEKISGDAVVECTYSTTPVVSLSEAAVDSIVMNLQNAQFADGKVDMLIAIPPMTFTSGITIEIVTIFGKQIKTRSSSLEIKRSNISNMNSIAIDDELLANQPDDEIWYTTIDDMAAEVYSSNQSIVSHSYADGLGIIKFNQELTSFDNSIMSGANIQEIWIPRSVTSIGKYAFRYYGAAAIHLPDGVKSIGDNAFGSCHNLESIHLPEQLESIGYNAFYSCTSMKKIHIPDSVNSIDQTAFQRCISLESFTGRAATGDGKYLVLGNRLVAAAGTLEDAVLPEGIESFGKVFGGSSIRKLVISEGVKSIESSAFAWSKLEEIVIPESVDTIFRSAFRETNLKEISIPSKVKCILAGTFSNCKKLEKITFPNNLQSLAGDAFLGCESLKQLAIPGTVKTIDGIFSLPSLKELVIGEGTETIGSISNLPVLESISIPGSIREIQDPIKNCPSLTTINSPYSSQGGKVLILNNKIIATAKGLTALVIPDGVTTISGIAGNKDIAYISVPESITEIPSGAFEGCSSLSAISLPSTITSIGSWAFSGCESLLSIDIPEGTLTIGDCVFTDCKSLTKFSGKYASPDGKYLSSQHRLYAVAKDVSSFDIPSDVYSIGSGAFSGCTLLTGITIPKYTSTIPQSAFSGCTSLYSVRFLTAPDVNVYIDDSAFAGCTSLHNIELPSTTRRIGKYAFSNCKCLHEMIIPDSVTELGKGVFKACGSLEVTLPSSVTNIPDEAFQDCKFISNGSIIIPEGVRHIGKNAFRNCFLSSLDKLVLPETLTEIADSAFCQSNLSSIIIPGSVTLSNACFANSTLNSVILNDGITTIPYGAFSGCKNLNSVVLPETLRYINGQSFESCTALTYVKIPEMVTRIYSKAFKDCSSLANVTMNCVSVPTISQDTFENNQKNRRFVVPSYMYDLYMADKNNWDSYKGSIVTY